MWKERVRDFLASQEFHTDPDWGRTSNLRRQVQRFKQAHPNSGLSPSLFKSTIRWKLGRQLNRDQIHLDMLNDNLIITITKATINLDHDNSDILTKVRVNTLQSLPGIGIGVASAFLTLYYPESYGIIDFRTWDEIHEVQPNTPTLRRNFTLNNYIFYLNQISIFSREINQDAQVIDFALWKIWERRRQLI